MTAPTQTLAPSVSASSVRRRVGAVPDMGAQHSRLARVPSADARLLFVPRCGRHGIGEYVRCLTLARAFAARHPGARIAFAARETLARLPGDAFERLPLAREAAQGEHFDAILAHLRPHLVVTNNR